MVYYLTLPGERFDGWYKYVADSQLWYATDSSGMIKFDCPLSPQYAARLPHWLPPESTIDARSGMVIEHASDVFVERAQYMRWHLDPSWLQWLERRRQQPVVPFPHYPTVAAQTQPILPFRTPNEQFMNPPFTQPDMVYAHMPPPPQPLPPSAFLGHSVGGGPAGGGPAGGGPTGGGPAGGGPAGGRSDGGSNASDIAVTAGPSTSTSSVSFEPYEPPASSAKRKGGKAPQTPAKKQKVSNTPSKSSQSKNNGKQRAVSPVDEAEEGDDEDEVDDEEGDEDEDDSAAAAPSSSASASASKCYKDSLAMRLRFLQLFVTKKEAFMRLSNAAFWKGFWPEALRQGLPKVASPQRMLFGDGKGPRKIGDGRRVLGWVDHRATELGDSAARNRSDEDSLLDEAADMLAERKRLETEGQLSVEQLMAHDREKQNVEDIAMGQRIAYQDGVKGPEALLLNRTSTRSIRAAKVINGEFNMEQRALYKGIQHQNEELARQASSHHADFMAASEQRIQLLREQSERQLQRDERQRELDERRLLIDEAREAREERRDRAAEDRASAAEGRELARSRREVEGGGGEVVAVREDVRRLDAALTAYDQRNAAIESRLSESETLASRRHQETTEFMSLLLAEMRKKNDPPPTDDNAPT